MHNIVYLFIEINQSSTNPSFFLGIYDKSLQMGIPLNRTGEFEVMIGYL